MDSLWGKGEVRTVWPDGKLTIFFAQGGERKLPPGAELEKLTGDDAREERLDVLPRNKRVRSSAGRPAPSIDYLKRDFMLRFTGGFRDPELLERERNWKLNAKQKLEDTLSRVETRALLDQRAFQEICLRARRVVQSTRLIDHHETIELNEATLDDDNAERYARSLVDLLYANDEYRARFERFVRVLKDLGGAKWPIATFFPFVAFPAEQMFLKPQATQFAARACGIELSYHPTPNWLTYSSLLTLTEALREKLADLEPLDNIDIQSFIWFAWKKDEYVVRKEPAARPNEGGSGTANENNG